MNHNILSVKKLILCLLTLVSIELSAQIKSQVNWQQVVNHTIDAKLNPKTNILSIVQKVEYTNNSPESLDYIYFHVWAEAFANKHTPFAKESIRTGVKNFVHSRASERSKVSDLSFKANSKLLSFSSHKDLGNEVIKVNLNQSLKTGESISIENTVSIYLPKIFSRFGTQKGFYSITQWYPKPAVFDVNGWNLFPYKSMGEYFSEYGTYDVSISLPSDFVVAATGELQNQEEIDWLNELSKGNLPIRDSLKIKTIRFTQDQVHDFAWFAAKGMRVSKENFDLAGNTLTAWSFVDKSKQGRGKAITKAVISGVKYYSKRVGNYPFKHCTAVIGPLEGAGGMEYPMITICESADEATIVHEVGHNWFQGMLGSNERVYPWMDESINTFYQNQLQSSKTKFEKTKKLNISQSNALFPAVVLGVGAHQATGLHSHEYSSTNYGVSVYINGPLQFMYLQEILGKELFDSCMQTYFKKYQFKHPLPRDIQDVFEKVSQENLDWFFKEVILGKPINFKLGSRHKGKHQGYIYKLKNKSNIPVSYEYWLNGMKYRKHTSEKQLTLPKGAYNLALNPNGYLLETNLHDNYANVSRKDPNPKNKIGIRGIATRGLNSHWILPNLITYNMHDGYSPGLIFSNIHLPRLNFEYTIAPSYGFKSENFVGQFRFNKNIVEPKGPFQRIQIALAGARYSFYPIEIFANDYNTNNLNVYTRIRPEVQFLFQRKKHWQHKLDLDYSYVAYDKNTWEYSNVNTGVITNVNYGDDKQRNIFRARFSSEHASKMSPKGVSLELSHDLGSYSRAIFNAFYSIPIPNPSQKKMSFRLHAFAVLNSVLDASQYHTRLFLSAPGMASDAAFREVSQYRSQNRQPNVNRFANTFVTTTVPSIRFPMPISVTGNYMTGFNAQTHLLPILPIQVYFDGVIATLGSSNIDKFWWTSGLVYSAFDDHRASFEVSIPLLYSANIKNVFELNYNKQGPNNTVLDPWEWYQMFQFKLNLKFNRLDNIIRKVVTK